MRALHGILRPAALLLTLVSAPAAVAAQAPATWGLISARFDTRTSDFIYAVYGYGNLFGMGAVLHNPRSGYGEALGAVGWRFSVGGGASQFAAVGAARATDAWYAQLYLVPTVHAGPVRARATAELYLPLEAAGSIQFALSPLSATVGVTRKLEAGLAYDLATAEGDAPSTLLGPELRWSYPRGVIGADLEKVIGGSGGRFRVFILTAF